MRRNPDTKYQKGSWLVAVIMICVSSFCGLDSQLVGNKSEMGSNNIVGYTAISKRTGEFTSQFRPVGGGDFKLEMVSAGELKPDVEFAFFDGHRWMEAISADADDGRVHWFLKDSLVCADQLTIPYGAAIRYKLPPDVDSLMFSGEVVLNDPEESPFMQEDVEMLKRIRKAVIAIKTILQPVKTETQHPLPNPPVDVQVKGGTPTNAVEQPYLPTRFILSARGYLPKPVLWDGKIYRICDAATGWPVELSSLEEVSFAVDTSPDIKDIDRMSEKDVEQLYTLIYPRTTPKVYGTVVETKKFPKPSFWKKCYLKWTDGFNEGETPIEAIFQTIVYLLFFSSPAVAFFWWLVRWFKRLGGYEIENKAKGKKRKHKQGQK